VAGDARRLEVTERRPDAKSGKFTGGDLSK
jgi:hypothetical protein